MDGYISKRRLSNQIGMIYLCNTIIHTKKTTFFTLFKFLEKMYFVFLLNDFCIIFCNYNWLNRIIDCRGCLYWRGIK